MYSICFHCFGFVWLAVIRARRCRLVRHAPTMNVQDSLAIVAYYHSMKCAEWKGDFHWDLTDYETWGRCDGYARYGEE